MWPGVLGRMAHAAFWLTVNAVQAWQGTVSGGQALLISVALGPDIRTSRMCCCDALRRPAGP